MRLFHPLWTFLREIRAPYFAAVTLPIVLGSVVAWARAGTFDLGLFVLALVAGIFLQAGTNMTNDYFDTQLSGEGAAFWTLVPPQQVLQGALGLFVVGAMLGVYIAALTGPLVLLLGVIGIASGYAYSVPPLRLSGSGFGELLAGLNLGLLTTTGGYYIQLRQVDAIVGWVALPVALLMSAVLVLNGFQPHKLAAGESLWARMGAESAAGAYALPALSGFALLIVGVALGRLPTHALLGLLALPAAAVAIAAARLGRTTLAVLGAVGAHLGATALLALAFLLRGVF